MLILFSFLVGFLSVLTAFLALKKLYSVGPRGLKGYGGPQGVIGDTGPSGSQGATGAQGERGKHGIRGLAGRQGIQGPVGATGPTGPAGLQNEAPSILLSGHVSAGSNTLFSSLNDGSTWTSGPSIPLNPMIQCASNGIVLVGIGPHSGTLAPYYSIDYGITWQKSPSNFNFNVLSLNTIACTGQEFILGATCSTSPTFGISESVSLFTSSNGIEWNPLYQDGPFLSELGSETSGLYVHPIKEASSILWTGTKWAIHGQSTYSSTVAGSGYNIFLLLPDLNSTPQSLKWFCTDIFANTKCLVPQGPQSMASRRVVTGQEPPGITYTEEILIVGLPQGSAKYSCAAYYWNHSVNLLRSLNGFNGYSNNNVWDHCEFLTVGNRAISILQNNNQYLLAGSLKGLDDQGLSQTAEESSLCFIPKQSYSTYLANSNGLYISQYDIEFLSLPGQTIMNSLTWTGLKWLALGYSLSSTSMVLLQSQAITDANTVPTFDSVNLGSLSSLPSQIRRDMWTPNRWPLRPTFASQLNSVLLYN